MKKLKLDLERLNVQSFETGPDSPDPRRGTVKGFATTVQPVGDTEGTCDTTATGGSMTWDATCEFSCYQCSGVNCAPFTQVNSTC
jgi:hypothetical protein